MTSAILWCRWTDCGARYASVGELPAICPACQRVGRWTVAPRVVAEDAAITWTDDDKRFLRAIRIATDP